MKSSHFFCENVRKITPPPSVFFLVMNMSGDYTCRQTYVQRGLPMKFATVLAILILVSCELVGGIGSVSAPSNCPDSLPPLRKFRITYSNNRLLDDRFKTLPLPKSCTSSYFDELREIVDKEVKLAGKSEFEKMLALNEWVHNQWKHDGGHLPRVGQTGLSVLMEARGGERFNCDGYSLVLNDVLISYGFVSRRIYMRTRKSEYSGPGQGHVANGVYSNQYGRWVFLDPQNNGRILQKGVPISWYEALLEHAEPHNQDVDFVSSEFSPESYKAFLLQYDGFISSPLDFGDGLQFVSLAVDTTLRPYLTFQGLPENGTIFTSNKNSLYMAVNGVSISFYSQQFMQFDSVVRKYDIDDHKEYVQFMPAFVPGPLYGLKLRHSIPWFVRYEIQLDDGPWIPIMGDQARVEFHDGMNKLLVRGVNEAGVESPPVRMDIMYE